jgi:small subunit ribosomal protein S16
MVRLRLTRMGRKKRPFYRIVAADSRSKRDGRHIEIIGHFDPMTEPATVKLNLDRVDYWFGVGATASDTVAALIKKARNAPAAPVADATQAEAAPVAEAADVAAAEA